MSIQHKRRLQAGIDAMELARARMSGRSMRRNWLEECDRCVETGWRSAIEVGTAATNVQLVRQWLGAIEDNDSLER
ncbi:hypothetical protein Q3G72_018650 [Acer saccharum]|nr:hypothetical protein Q3G72_018650 [Acer saccharum]